MLAKSSSGAWKPFRKLQERSRGPRGRLVYRHLCLGGLQVFCSTGEYLGTIPISVRQQNLAFAGPDRKSLYVVGTGVAFKIQMLSQGLADRLK